MNSSDVNVIVIKDSDDDDTKSNILYPEFIVLLSNTEKENQDGGESFTFDISKNNLGSDLFNNNQDLELNNKILTFQFLL